MSKLLKTVFCTLFFAVCLFFSLATFIPGASRVAEGGVERPALFADGKINDDFGSEYEEYFSKAFAYRGNIVGIWSRARAAIGDGNDQVIVGKDDFLFFADTIDCYIGNPMSDEEISAAADALESLAAAADKRGAKFLFVPSPNKNHIYPEKMPSRFLRTAQTDLDRLLAELDKRGLEGLYLDPRQTLLNAKSERLVYHRRDTHWNQDGALAVFTELSKRLELTTPEMSEITRTEPRDLAGDLDSLLFPSGKRYDLNPTYDLSEYYIFTSAYTSPMDMSISARGAGQGKALIFRDSFANAMIPFLASSFAEIQFERANPYRIDLLNDFDADTVILILAERNIRTLIGSDARSANITQ